MDTKTLLAVYNITEDEATAYVNAKTNAERQIIDITRISRLNTFSAKIAKTIIANNFKSISPKQAEILEQDSIDVIDITANYSFFIEEKMRERERNAFLA